MNPRRFTILLTNGEEVGFRVTGPNREEYVVTGGGLWSGREPDKVASVIVRPPVVEPTEGDAVFSVQGVVTDAAGVAAVGLNVEAWDRSVAGKSLLGTASTDTDGRYVITYEESVLSGKPAADLLVRVVITGREAPVLAESDTLFQAPQHATVDLVVERADVPTAPEHGRLLAQIKPLLGDRQLRDIDASGVSYLAGRGAWDARGVAMAARAEQLSHQTQIPASHFYALMRAGLPGDLDQIFRLSDSMVRELLGGAALGGVISANDDVEHTLRLYREAALESLSQFRPEGRVSSLGEMLSVRLDATQRRIFLDAYRSSNNDPDALWSQLVDRGFDKRTISALQTDAVLGELTRQNAPVVARVVARTALSDAAELVDHGFYRAAAWRDLVGDDVPEGLTVEQYTSGLAAQVATRFPARVTADLVRNDAVAVAPEAKEEVAAFFAQPNANTLLGAVPVRTWEGFAGLSPRAMEGTLKVERLFQISPSNDAMVTLSSVGIDSALQVMRYSPTGFMAKLGDKFPSPLEARLTYAKAQQVHTTTLSIATQYLAYRGGPNVYSITGQLFPHIPVPAPEIAASATLEDLFGSMDYCSCDHCRSVLSPAAYLVELLEFLDVSDEPHQLDNPLDVLRARRPDLWHLGLSCENTNTALPYVDLVLEILEHWVVTGTLADFEGHDTRPDAATADLLAEPDFVIDTAYDTTKAAVYPSPLPFDAPLAHLRSLFEVWDTSLPAVLDVLGTPADARREWLGLNAAELSLLTNVGRCTLPELYGEPPSTTLAALNEIVGNAKTFSRRTDVTYDQLANLLRSPFVNPGSVLMPLLDALDVSMGQLQQWFDGTLSDGEFTDKLPDDLDPTPYGDDVLAWLTAKRDLIMGTITLTDMRSPDDTTHECDFGRIELRHVRPNMSANQLTEIDHHRLLRFIRLWKKLGWSITATDIAIAAFLRVAPETLTIATIDAEFAAMLDRLAGFLRLANRLDLSAKARDQWLALFDPELDPTARQDRLAPLLNLGTVDLDTLLDLSGIDPFADDLGSADPSLLRLVDCATLLKGTKLKVTDIDFLLRNADPTGKLTPTPAQVERDLLAVRKALIAVDTGLAVPAATADLAAAATRMALVYDPAVVDRFLGLVAGTTTYSVPLVTAAEVLPAPVNAIAPGMRIDPFHNTLTSSGLLSPATRAALDTATAALTLADIKEITTPEDLTAFKAALTTAFQGLQDASDAELNTLAEEFPELKTLYEHIITLTDSAARAEAIIVGILPELRATLRGTALRTVLATVTKADVELIDALASAPVVLHADGDTSVSFLADFLGLDTPPALGSNGPHTLLLDPPSSADFLLYVAAPTGTWVTLAVDDREAIQRTQTGAAGELRSPSPFALTAGDLVQVTLTLEGLAVGQSAELRWRTNALAKAAVPASRMYDGAAYKQAERTLRRMQKTVLAVQALGLTAGEAADLGAVWSVTAGLWNGLAVDTQLAANDVKAQWARLAWVLWFEWLKRTYEPEKDTFLRILRDSAAVDAQGKLVVAGVMGWAEANLTAVLSKFGLKVSDLGDLENLRRVIAALELVSMTLQPAADLAAWTVPDPDGPLVRSIREKLKGRMDLAAWRESMQSVSDAVRNARRDALVAYILHHATPSPDIETPDQLYEHFLVDVQMDACMQTSRIRLALSTVQLFVQRCLLNLEKNVSPSSINADHWTWMRRYRVWEANRKVFLYPENWLEPELRDGKSPFFRDLESELLKADITQDLAETAYLHYLRKLDDVAHLEIAGAYLEEKTPGTTDDDILHIIGRTLGNTREHWYRRYESGYWTPWEKIGLNIEGDIVVPVVWKKRLFVFWVTTLVQAKGNPEKSPTDIADKPSSESIRVDATVTLHRGEYFRGTWQSPKSIETSTSLTWPSLDSFDPRNIRCSTTVYTPTSVQGDSPPPERLEFRLAYIGLGGYYDHTLIFTRPNAQPQVLGEMPLWALEGDQALILGHSRTPSPLVDANQCTYPGKVFTVWIQQPSEPKAPVPAMIMTKTANLVDGFRVRPTLQDGVRNPWEMPLFYTDERSVFFLSGEEQRYHEGTPHYFDDLIIDGATLRLPPLCEKPVKVKVPIPVDPVINPAWAFQIPVDTVFVFGGTTFDAGGAAKTQRSHNR